LGQGWGVFGPVEGRPTMRLLTYSAARLNEPSKSVCHPAYQPRA
jgi:hypothetical protein